MADQPITDDPIVAALDGNEIVPVVVPGVPGTNERTTTAAVAAFAFDDDVAGVAIPALPAASLPLAGAEVIPVVVSGAVRRVTADDVAPALRAEVVNARGAEVSLEARLAAIAASIPPPGNTSAAWPDVPAGGYAVSASDSGQGLGSIGGSANRLDLSPVSFGYDFLCDEFGVYCTTAAVGGTLARVVVYESDSRGLPTNLILDTGTFNAATINTFYGATPPGGDFTFLAGRVYWCGIHFETANSGSYRSVVVAGQRGIGFGDGANASAHPTLLRVTETFASGAPDPWPTVVGAQYTSSTTPLVFLRRKV